jgi:GAF domain-containing protein
VSTFGSGAAPDEEPLSYSYCKYVVAYDDVLAVQDSHTDPLVSHNLSTTIKGLRAYLGVPLHSRGQTIGSLCVFDVKPRQWSADDLNNLFEVAGLMEDHIENQMVEDES